jgi:AraC family transcriptional regulator
VERSIPPLGNAPDALARILDKAPPVLDGELRDHTLLTNRWSHGELHDHLPAMRGHVAITYYGDAQDIVWRVDGRRLASRTRPGSITLIPEGHEGRWDIAGPIHVSHVFLSQARLQACAQQIAGIDNIELLERVGFEDPTTARIMEMLGREASAADPSATLFMEQATDLLCTQLVRGHSSYRALAVAGARGGLADWRVKKVDAYMREHLDQPISLDQLADLVGLSRFHFATAFRQATGRTPHDYLTDVRMERARVLLSNPSQPVTDIAFAVGYGTPSAFAASFRKTVGMTPTAFRQGL